MEDRRPFLLKTLLRDLERQGIVRFDPNSRPPPIGCGTVYAALLALRPCPAGLPASVLAAAAGCETDEFERAAAGTDLLMSDGGDGAFWRPAPGTPPVEPADPGGVLGRGLAAAARFVKDHPLSEAGDRALASVVPLAEACAPLNPAAVAGAFSPLDKPLKRRGNKRDVLKLADLAIGCADRAASGGDARAMREAKAKALVCGRTWVYQRVGEFEAAERFAVESLKLGEALGWVRNTAFTQKCRGRLRRVEAERMTHGGSRKASLRRSRELLGEAIAAFAAEPDFGPTCPEVGDCHSLLARTELLADRLPEAAAHAKTARGLIGAASNYPERKDYIDLLILEGDLAAARFDYGEAEAKYDEAIGLAAPLNAEHSEIAARALFARGRNLLRRNAADVDAACAEYAKAADLWRKLGDDHHVGLARWEVARLRTEFPGSFLKAVEKESPPVRVIAAGRYEDLRRRQAESRTLALRADLPERLVTNLIREARKSDAESRTPWES